jgi:hypothetical protein
MTRPADILRPCIRCYRDRLDLAVAWMAAMPPQRTPDASATEAATTVTTPRPTPISPAAGPRRLRSSHRDGRTICSRWSLMVRHCRLSISWRAPGFRSLGWHGSPRWQTRAASGAATRLVRVDVAEAQRPHRRGAHVLEVLFRADWRADDAAIPALNTFICYEFPGAEGPSGESSLQRGCQLADGTDGLGIVKLRLAAR